jgi:hypothetical protein
MSDSRTSTEPRSRTALRADAVIASYIHAISDRHRSSDDADQPAGKASSAPAATEIAAPNSS